MSVYGARTSAAGIERLRAIATPAGWTVVAVPATKVPYPKSAVTTLPDGTIIGSGESLDDAGILPDWLAARARLSPGRAG